MLWDINRYNFDVINRIIDYKQSAVTEELRNNLSSELLIGTTF